MKFYLKLPIFLLITLNLIFPHITWANSGPTFWQGFPSSEVLTVDKDCPIEVASEKLTFDLRNDNNLGYSIKGKVKASYEMVNPLDRDLSVQMAFPFVGTLNDFSPSDVIINVDGTNLPYKLYIGDVVHSYGNPFQKENEVSLAFQDILGTISNSPYQAEYFSQNEKGNLYILEVRPTTDQRINLALDFEFNKEKTKVLTNGFNRYERNGQKVRIASWCYEPEILEIFVLGEDIDFKINAFTDGELKQKTELYEYEISPQVTELKPYLKDLVLKYGEKFRGESRVEEFEKLPLDEIQFYNLYEGALDRAFSINEGFSSCEELMDQDRYKRVFTLIYNVDFPADFKRNVTVSYEAAGTMDRRETAQPVYSFEYLLNPAGNWSRFGKLDIEIFPPQEAPYIVDSSIELTREGDGHYRASLDSLPQEDLSFSIYGKEKISSLDKVAKFFQYPMNYFLSFFILILVGIPSIIILVVRKISKNIPPRK